MFDVILFGGEKGDTAQKRNNELLPLVIARTGENELLLRPVNFSWVGTAEMVLGLMDRVSFVL